MENFVIGLGKLTLGIGKVCWHGFSRTLFKKAEGLLLLLILVAAPFALVYWNWAHLLILNWAFPSIFSVGVVQFFVLHVSQFLQFVVLAAFLVVPLGVVLGFSHYFRMVRYQRELRHIGLKSATGSEPRVVDVEEPALFKKKIIIASQGIGVEQYQSKKSDLESSFGAIVEENRRDSVCKECKKQKSKATYVRTKKTTPLKALNCFIDLITEIELELVRNLQNEISQIIERKNNESTEYRKSKKAA